MALVGHSHHPHNSSFTPTPFQFSSSAPNTSFERAVHITSPPSATPPPSRGFRSSVSFHEPLGRPSTDMMQTNGANGYHQVNGNSQGQNGGGAQIYTAIYSSVPVYEMEVNRIAVMRRRSDSWLNATQILKVAGIEKGKRTKVLEKEILPGQHEKVQGGYGKYQGTWISYERGVEFCRQYGVEELLRPLLEHDMGQDGMTTAGSGGVETPTKEQAMAAQRKRLYGTGIENSRPNGPSPNGTFFKNISSTASSAVAAISKARFDSPGPKPIGRQNSARKQSFQNSQESNYPGGSQQSMHSMVSENSFNNNVDSAYGTQNGVYFNQSQESNGDMNEPPRKKLRPSSSQDVSMQMNDSVYSVSMRDATPTEANESFMYRQNDSFLPPEDVEESALQPLPQPTSKSALEKQRLLTSLFLDPHQNDFSLHPALQRLSGEDLDTPLDQPAHTALHWAATLGRLSLAKILIARGASIFRVNAGGETALDKACSATNNHEQASFPDFLDLLGPTIDIKDGRGRTVLHHISLTSAVKGRMAASIYYLESLLEFVVRQGSAPNSQQNSFVSNAGIPPAKAIGLASFMHNIVNAQDKAGDTALNIAARGRCRSIVQQLIEVQADSMIPNRVGLRPRDFGVGADADEANSVTAVTQYAGQADDMAPTRIVGETSRDIINSISSLLTQTEKDFRTELRAKQDQIDKAHTELREISAVLADDQRKLQILEKATSERRTLKLKIQNLERFAEEQRFLISQQESSNSGALAVQKIGDPSTELVVDKNLLPAKDQDTPLTQAQFEYVNSFPSIKVLRAKKKAYDEINQGLSKRVADLKNRSAELEATYRKVISLCSGCSEESVDENLGAMITAIEAEGEREKDPTRVRDFMRKYGKGEIS